MSDLKANFVPGDPINFPIRPLNKGIQVHLPPQLSEAGSLQNAMNYQVTPGGLLRREAHRNYGSGATVDYPPIQDLYVFFDSSSGLQKTVVLDQKFVYELSASGLTGKYWTYDTGTITATAANVTITGSGTSWTGQNLLPGDVIILDADGSANGPEELIVKTITNDTSIDVVTAPVNSHAAGTDYVIRRAFSMDVDRFVDAVVEADNELILVDGGRTPYVYDGTSFGQADASTTLIPSCVGYFRDRLYFGKVVVSGTEYRYRVAWTDPGVFGTIPITNYVDLPYQAGELLRLVPMGNNLVAFFQDAVYIGIPTQMPTLPLYFQRLDIANIGLIGMKAVVQYFDSLFFVGQDNIYVLSTQGTEPIGTPIIKRTIDECSNKAGIYAVVDSKRSRVIFGFPKSGDDIEELWTYDYRSKAWGVEGVACRSLSTAAIYTGYTIDGLDSLSATIDGLDSYFAATDEMSYSSSDSANIYIGVGGLLQTYNNNTTDQGSVSIIGVIETQDYDLGKPNKNKTYSELSLKLEQPLVSNLTFLVEGSTNRGTSWKTLGNLTITAGETEGKTDFKLTGGIGRFRLTTQTNNYQYTVNEIVFKVKLRGQEVRYD